MQQEQEDAIRCRAPFCAGTFDGLPGRLFVPPENAQGLSQIWCAPCIKIGNEVQFFCKQTAGMIREKYQAYRPEDLPPKVGLVLEQFAKEILHELGEEL